MSGSGSSGGGGGDGGSSSSSFRWLVKSALFLILCSLLFTFSFNWWPRKAICLAKCFAATIPKSLLFLTLRPKSAKIGQSDNVESSAFLVFFIQRYSAGVAVF